MSETPKNSQELGCLWIKNGQSGEFFSGNIVIGTEKINIVVFPNTKKPAGSNQPDFRILKSTVQGDAKGPAKPAYVSRPAQAKPTTPELAARKPVVPQRQPVAAVEEIQEEQTL